MKPARVRRGKKPTFVVGVDFGTLSGRAVLVDASNGREVATAVAEYPHGVITERLPGTKKPLPPETALQNPADYLKVLTGTVPKVLRRAGARPEQVVGIGTDFTSCTMLPVTADGTPLCVRKRWRANPHAWVKLWKHHSAQPQANRITELGLQRQESFIPAYGGRYSSEWFFSKLLETVQAAPAVYDNAARLIEAGDWIVWQLCGEEKRSLSAAGYKAMCVYSDEAGRWTYPGREFFRTLHPKLENVVSEKLQAPLLPPGSRAGGLTRNMADRLGLVPGTPVAVGNIDAHVAVPACTVTDPGKLMMIIGTSTCHLLLARERHEVEGMCGVVKDGIVPGLWGYEAGQAGVGDLFAWFIDQGVPAHIQLESKRAGMDMFQWLEAKAARLKAGEAGLLALDWWSGCRSVLMDSDLTGLLVGATLSTKPHEIYRSLIEATAFGTRKIIEAFESQGVPIREVYASGGLAQKSPLLMQIYADVTNRQIKVAASSQTSALGAAMQATVAAGVYPDIQTAATSMARVRTKVYKPIKENRPIYERLYAEYSRLYDLFGRNGSQTMKILRHLKRQAIEVP